ncbi:MAG TPA: hypothetical protein VFF13_04885 [archaeon]|nr:hypothetical protein [archaeon]
MNVLIITPYAEPEKGAAVVRVNAFREYFTGKGAKVSVFAPKRGMVPELNGVKRYSGLFELMKIVFSGKFDVIIGTSPPITHNFFALLAGKVSGKRFFLDAKDPFTEVMKKLEPQRSKGIKFRFFEFIEWCTHKFSDRVIFLNKPYLENAVKRFSLDGKKVFLAPNGSDTKKIFFSEKERKALREKLVLKDSPTIIFVGGTGDKDLLGFVEKSFPELSKKTGAKTVLVLSYEGAEAQSKVVGGIKKIASEKGIENELKIAFNAEFSELHKYLSACDVGLVAYPDFEMQVVGAKVFDYIAAGLPVAAKASKGNSVLKEFVEENKIGFFCSDWGEFNRQFIRNFGGKNFNGKTFSGKDFARKKIMEAANENSREKGCEKVFSEMKIVLGEK